MGKRIKVREGDQSGQSNGREEKAGGQKRMCTCSTRDDPIKMLTNSNINIILSPDIRNPG